MMMPNFSSFLQGIHIFCIYKGAPIDKKDLFFSQCYNEVTEMFGFLNISREYLEPSRWLTLDSETTWIGCERKHYPSSFYCLWFHIEAEQIKNRKSLPQFKKISNDLVDVISLYKDGDYHEDVGVHVHQLDDADSVNFPSQYEATIKMKSVGCTGLHQKYAVNVDILDDLTSWINDSEIRIIQMLPRDAYVDVDEAKTIWEYNISSPVHLLTPFNASINVELPAMVSQPQQISYSFSVPNGITSFSFQIVLPLKLRYNYLSFGTEELYRKIAIPPPAVYLMRGSVTMFAFLKPSNQIEDMMLLVPVGNLSDWSTVVIFTTLASLVGTALILQTLFQQH